ncbi:MAG: RagB/SusD family nutrient uptake outer membrane protein [Dysgonamonadaceae bacterium]|nr:RagB/SusD family nutrient uptake outer membrane protein [Dysgonamonadaceae bacterium]
MKRILLSILTLPLLFGACNDLDLAPVNALDNENFFRSDEDVILAVNGVYAAMVESESVVISWCVEMGSDYQQNGESMPSGSGAELSAFQFNAGNSHTYWAWSDHFYGIANAAKLISVLDDPETPVSDGIRHRVRGEAKFLRAYYNFDLVQLFGEIPLIISGGADDGAGVERQPVQAVYAQIEKDLIEAAEDLKDYPTTDAYGDADKGRITQQAAYGLLSKVYLTWAQTDDTPEGDKNSHYTNAVRYADLVTGYFLEENYHRNWEKDNRYGKEVLFATNYVVSQESFGDGGNHLTHCAFSTGFNQETPHVVASDRTYFDRFDDSDQRKLGTYLTQATNPDNNETIIFNLPRYAKYVDIAAPATSSKNRELNATILRYAEVLLVKAEAINERDKAPNQEAYDAINKVRRRAYKLGEYADGTATVSLSDIEYKNLDYKGFRKALRRERLLELTYEQVRWFDLKRWHVLQKTVKRVQSHPEKQQNVKAQHYRFPVPQSQRDLNSKLTQNWGYPGSDAAVPVYASADYEGDADNNDGWTDEEVKYLYEHISEPK